MDVWPRQLVETSLIHLGYVYDIINDETVMAKSEGEQAYLLTCISANQDRLRMDTIYPFMAASARRMLVAQFAAYCNCYLDTNTVTIDPDDGEVGLRAGYIFGDENLSLGLIEVTIRHHLTVASCLITGLASVLFAETSPRVAFEQCLRPCRIDEAIDQANWRMQSG